MLKQNNNRHLHTDFQSTRHISISVTSSKDRYRFYIDNYFCLNVTFNKIISGSLTLKDPAVAILEDVSLSHINCYETVAASTTCYRRHRRQNKQVFKGQHSHFSWFSSSPDVEIVFENPHKVLLVYQIFGPHVVESAKQQSVSHHNPLVIYKLLPSASHVVVLAIKVRKLEVICVNYDAKFGKMVGIFWEQMRMLKNGVTEASRKEHFTCIGTFYAVFAFSISDGNLSVASLNFAAVKKDVKQDIAIT